MSQGIRLNPLGVVAVTFARPHDRLERGAFETAVGTAVVQFLKLKGVLIGRPPQQTPWNRDELPQRVVADLFSQTAGQFESSGIPREGRWEDFLAATKLAFLSPVSLAESAAATRERMVLISRGTAAHPLDGQAGEDAVTQVYFPGLLQVTVGGLLVLTNSRSIGAVSNLGAEWGGSVSFRFPDWLVHQHAAGGPFRKSGGVAWTPIADTVYKRAHQASLRQILDTFQLSLGDQAEEGAGYEVPYGVTASYQQNAPTALILYPRSSTGFPWSFMAEVDVEAIVR